jgi:toxin YoeB
VAAKRDRSAVFHVEFREDLKHWVETDRRIAIRVVIRAWELVEAIMRDPFEGIGKPEPLKYLVSETRVDFLQARYHY